MRNRLAALAVAAALTPSGPIAATAQDLNTAGLSRSGTGIGRHGTGFDGTLGDPDLFPAHPAPGAAPSRLTPYGTGNPASAPQYTAPGFGGYQPGNPQPLQYNYGQSVGAPPGYYGR
ncbi:MAG: hypothetical protein JO038_01815 [Alphaproteobacteria bacterium]|nr:hypothetical protein [Alphaproteobacteria bacterium]